jgi:hypothetical protein
MNVNYQKIEGDIYFEDINFHVCGIIKFEKEEPKPPENTTTDDVVNTQQTSASKLPAPKSVEVTKKIQVEEEPKLMKIKLISCRILRKTECKNIVDYIDHIMKFKYSESQLSIKNDIIKISGDQFIILKKYINSNREFYTPKNVFSYF